MFWLRSKEINFQLHTLIWWPEMICSGHLCILKKGLRETVNTQRKHWFSGLQVIKSFVVKSLNTDLTARKSGLVVSDQVMLKQGSYRQDCVKFKDF